MDKTTHKIYRKYYADEMQKDKMTGKYYTIDEFGQKIYIEE